MPVTGFAFSSSKTDGCPCCEDRIGKRGGFQFIIKGLEPELTCQECLLPSFDYGSDKPPFVWPHSKEDIDNAIKQVTEETKLVLDTVAKVELPADGVITDDATTLKLYDAIIKPLIHNPCYKTNPLVCQSKHMQHCSTDPEIRKLASDVTPALANLKKEGRLRKDIYGKVKAYKEMCTESVKNGSIKNLSDFQIHFINAILDGFERNGLGLSDEDNNKLKKSLDDDVDYCNSYKTNLAEDKTKILFKSAEELKGCSEEWVKEKANQETGEIELTLKYPDILPVLQNCEIEESRKKITLAREQAYGNNLELVVNGVKSRKESAKILGYESWSHFITKGRMSGSPETVLEFLNGIQDKVRESAGKDKTRLLELKKAHLKELGNLSSDNDITLNAWDVSFYHTLLLKREYGLDHEEIKKFFPCNVVVESTLKIYQDLLGLVFTELYNFDTWHPDVRLFIVHDKQNPEKRMGHFYLDLHPRDGKYNHAAIFHLLKRNDDKGFTPVDCMLTNLPPPSSDGKPALLRHDDVVTFFHEFGHIMHGLLAVGSGNSTTLAKCPRDFVEAPSQMLENWCFDPNVLKLLSKHIDTNNSLPQDQIDKLIKAKNVNEALMLSRQIYLAKLDMAIHGETPPNSIDELQSLVDKMRLEISHIANPPGCNMLRNFGHLMNQYSSAYYGYLWSEILSADMFASKFSADPFSAVSGKEYRDKVLGVGGIGKISEHLEGFLGHKPDQLPFLKSRGIIAA